MRDPGLIAQPAPGIGGHAASDRDHEPDDASGQEECVCRGVAGDVLLHVVIALMGGDCSRAAAEGPEQVFLGRQLDKIATDALDHRLEARVERRWRWSRRLLKKVEARLIGWFSGTAAFPR